MAAANRVALRALPLLDDPYSAFDNGSLESEAYAEMAGAGYWAGADKVYLDGLKARDPRLYLETLSAEGLAREFNAALDRQMSRTGSIVRWMDAEELASYAGGTFEQDGGGRGGGADTRRSASERPSALGRAPPR